MSNGRELGFKETIETIKSYGIAFDRMKEAKMIP